MGDATKPEKNFIQKIFSSVKPYGRKAEGIGTGVSESEALGYDILQNSIYGVTSNKRHLYMEYTDMSMYPEVADAIDEIVSEAITNDEDNQIVSLKILDNDLAENENIVQNLQNEFDYVINDILDFSTTAGDLFRKFYVEGEVYGEMKIGVNVSEGLKGIQILPSYSMTPVYDANQNVKMYKQSLLDLSVSVRQGSSYSGKNMDTTTEIEFEPSQVAYVNSGLINLEKNLVYSYLERAKIAYRQLKWMENAVIIYRITRAPERRVFYIDVGKLPKSKADQYLKSLITKYKNKKIYNPSTGEIDVGKDVMSMTEDYYFATRPDGGGSRVDTLPGGQLAGELDDVEYFLFKLYKALKVPTGRIKKRGAQGGDFGESGEAVATTTEITRDEIKFAKYVAKIRQRFLEFAYQVFFTHLELKGLFRKYDLDKNKLAIVFNVHNPWKENLLLQSKQRQGEVFEIYSQFTEVFPTEYLLKEIMQMSDDEIADMKAMMKTQIEEGGFGGAGEGDGDEGGEDSGAGDEGGEEDSPEEGRGVGDPDDIPALLHPSGERHIISDKPEGKKAI